MNLKHHIGTLFAFTIGTCGWAGDHAPGLKAEQDRANYSAGSQTGALLQQKTVSPSQGAVLENAPGGQTGSASLVAAAATQHDHSGEGHGHPAKATMSQQEIAQGRLFLAKNAKEKGVHNLANGLEYQVLNPGSGRMPKATDWVTLKYEGSLPNGQFIGKSVHDGKPGPARYLVKRLIPGLREALLRMKEGERWRVFVPPELSYPLGSSALEHRVVIYNVELLSVEPTG